MDQELEEGLRAIAAPIHGSGDTVTAAINVSAHASRVSMAAMRSDLLPGAAGDGPPDRGRPQIAAQGLTA